MSLFMSSASPPCVWVVSWSGYNGETSGIAPDDGRDNADTRSAKHPGQDPDPPPPPYAATPGPSCSNTCSSPTSCSATTAADRKLLAFLTDQSVVRKILEHLDLPADPPPVAQARPPPQPALPFL